MDQTAIIVALLALIGQLVQSVLNNRQIKRQDIRNEMKEIKNETQEIRQQVGLLKGSEMHSLQDRLLYLCRKYIERGWITLIERQLLTNLYTSYRGLNGNEFITDLYNEAKQLPIKK